LENDLKKYKKKFPNVSDKREMNAPKSNVGPILWAFTLV
jgi:hypothetical protein